MQPGCQSAGYEEEDLNPAALGLDVSVTVIAAPLGVSSLGESRVRSSGWVAEEGRAGGSA